MAKLTPGVWTFTNMTAAVRAEAGAGELVVAVHEVQGQVEDPAALVQAAHVLLAAAVLAQDEPAARADGDVVGRVEDLGRGRLEDAGSAGLRTPPRGRYSQTCPARASPPLVALKNTLPPSNQQPSSRAKAAPPRGPALVEDRAARDRRPGRGPGCPPT